MAAQALSVEPVAVNPFYYLDNIQVNFEELNATTGIWAPVITDPPVNVQTDQRLRATFEWTQHGFFAATAVPPGLPVQFYADLIFERMGAGSDMTFSFGPYAFQSGNGLTYSQQEIVELGAGPGELPQGLYKVIVLFRMGFAGGLPNDTPVVGFRELGMINVYKAD